MVLVACVAANFWDVYSVTLAVNSFLQSLERSRFLPCVSSGKKTFLNVSSEKAGKNRYPFQISQLRQLQKMY